MLSLECVKKLLVSFKELDTEYFNDVVVIPDCLGYKIIDIFSGNVFYLRVGDGFFIFMLVNEPEMNLPNKKKIHEFGKKNNKKNKFSLL